MSVAKSLYVNEHHEHMRSLLLSWNAGKWIFKDVENLGYPFHHIHPYKQNIAKFMVDNKPGWVDHIIVFGSAVKRGHFHEEDLDICLVGPNIHDIEDFGQIKLPKVRYDIVPVRSIKELQAKAEFAFGSVYYHILKEGVLIT